jgi:hypothetical protein
VHEPPPSALKLAETRGQLGRIPKIFENVQKDLVAAHPSGLLIFQGVLEMSAQLASDLLTLPRLEPQETR